MIASLIKYFSGSHIRKFLKKSQPLVQAINRIETEYQKLSDDELRALTSTFKQRFQDGETLDDLLPEAFAAVKNAARRLCGKNITVCEHELVWDMVHFDVQLVGGMALHQMKIAEMATGEGKTLVATLPLYLNALSGRNVQLVTVNDYLARRDSEWMGYLFKFLGLSVGCIQNQMPPQLRKEMYNRDITYGTASEFGFDYLRDNGMAMRAEDQVQRDHFFVIIDEVDSILIDEARTPLIISGPAAINREQPFTKLRSVVESVVSAQTRLCNGFISEVREALEKGDLDSEAEFQTSLKMLQVKLGMPKNKQLLRLMETGKYRKFLDRVETEMNGDMNKARLYALKEELYYSLDEKQHQADLTEKGRQFLQPDNPDAFLLPDMTTLFVEIDKDASLSAAEKESRKQGIQQQFENTSETIHAISQLLRAYSLYEKDVEYVVQEGKVVIVDQNTGRIMPGRRWSDGLHQAVEAKEGVTIERETRTFATVTIQNFFRMYEKLAGMTGTAETEATEFHDIYRLGVVTVPTNRPSVRQDFNDVIYKTRREKYNSVLECVREAHQKGQPVLVGTASVEASELFSRMLRRATIPHTVLNAKFHQQEAEIISRAGIRGAVTIATNMAGRGTDIKLGEGVKELGGLFVVGTERHESRRIDRQLRGRCARQGDPGVTRFFISLEDDLMRLFASSGPLARMMEGSMKEGDQLEHPLLNRSIESAQKKVEQQNYSIRKRLLQYDDVLNKQREVVYGIRNDALRGENPREVLLEMVTEEIGIRLEDVDFGKSKEGQAQALDGVIGWINNHFPVSLKAEELQGKSFEEAVSLIMERIRKAYALKESADNKEALVHLERWIIMNGLDNLWQEHLTEMEELRRSIGLRSYGQKDPLVEYKNEAFKFFEEMMNNFRIKICTSLFRSASNLIALENIKLMLARQAEASQEGVSAGSGSTAGKPRVAGRPATAGAANQPTASPGFTVKREMPKIGRNEKVTILNPATRETQTVKFKKAEPLLESGQWRLVDTPKPVA